MTTRSGHDDGQTTERDADRTQQNADPTVVVRVLRELEQIEPIGEDPNPGYAVFAMRREADWYDDGERTARVSIPAALYGDPHEAAERFRIRYTEAFDQILPPFGADDWIAVHRFLQASDGAGLCVAPGPDRSDEVIA